RPAARKEAGALTAKAEDTAVPPPEPEHLWHLLELPVQGQLREQEAIGYEHVTVDAGARERADTVQPVDHVARGHVLDAATHPHPAIGLAKGVKRPWAPLQDLSRHADAAIER